MHQLVDKADRLVQFQSPHGERMDSFKLSSGLHVCTVVCAHIPFMHIYVHTYVNTQKVNKYAAKVLLKLSKTFMV